ncbi:DUF2971 domain-containing protein [Bacillus sp. ISL-4]|uniref:DUF2971 domain-containing protein n=1 Tax=Bacillus sp. ISL-4 TaxID=2819125 RepID=UPI001BEBEB23|nr:DUF2971 domain-containing protein [Bacillus sp. ISL-4]MBT2667334.1 DUF2971 domain-containing protein [Bacillus sp. ISL-4]MBT2669430.1 hypothetical protein [Streptomyces sp. ISL-14]
MPTRKLQTSAGRTGYNLEKWRKRTKERSDITAHLTHLTRIETKVSDAVDTLIKMLNERKINGSDINKGFIVGDNPAVCFQEAPLYGVSQNVYHEQQNKAELGGKRRYDAIGLSFSKRYVYEKGGRPVLYEDKEIAKQILPQEEWWRIVNFNLSNENRIIDWTHEREWRVKSEFEFDLSETYVLLLNQSFYKHFINKVDHEVLKELKGIIVLQPILE